MDTHRQNQGFIIPAIIAIVVLAVIAGGYVVVKQKNAADQAQQAYFASMKGPVPPASTEDALKDMGWVTYTNNNDDYTLLYPSNWKVDGHIGALDEGVSIFNVSQPADVITIKKLDPSHPCVESSWKVGERDENVGTACLSDDKRMLQMSFAAFNDFGKETETKIEESLKSIGADGLDYPRDNTTGVPVISADWKKYTGPLFTIQYPSDWSAGIDSVVSPMGPVEFCPPELADKSTVCKLKNNSPHMPETSAPVVLQAYEKNPPPIQSVDIRVWSTHETSYALKLIDTSYRDTFNKMADSFNFTN